MPMRNCLTEMVLISFAIACSPPPPGKSAEADASAANAQSPNGAAGFDFGATPTDIKKACEGAGKTWRSDNSESGICSGPAADFPFDAPVRVDFCKMASCVIALEYRPKSNWLAAHNDVKQKLAKEHGTPVAMPNRGIPEKCRGEERFAQCLETARLQLEYRWQWPNRKQVTFATGKPADGEGSTAIRIQYVAPPTGADSKSDGS